MIIQTYYGCDMTFDSAKTTIDEKFIILPRRCILSGRWMYLEKVVHVIRRINKIDVGMRYMIEHHYVDPREYFEVVLKS